METTGKRYRDILIQEIFAQLEILLPARIKEKPDWYGNKYNELNDMNIDDLERLSASYQVWIDRDFPPAHPDKSKFNLN